MYQQAPPFGRCRLTSLGLAHQLPMLADLLSRVDWRQRLWLIAQRAARPFQRDQQLTQPSRVGLIDSLQLRGLGRQHDPCRTLERDQMANSLILITATQQFAGVLRSFSYSTSPCAAQNDAEVSRRSCASGAAEAPGDHARSAGDA
jgi:hypothetical protein